ncbi:AtpI F0F1-type ATP synthase, subunit I [Methylophilaceae bacterium]
MSASITSDVFSKMLKVQLVATLAVAIIALLVSGLNAGVSAVLGGVTVLLGAIAATLIAKRSAPKQDPTAILVNLLKAEAVKILVIIILLAIIFNVYKQLVPFALIAGLAAAALFSGAALSRLKV